MKAHDWSIPPRFDLRLMNNDDYGMESGAGSVLRRMMIDMSYEMRLTDDAVILRIELGHGT